MGGKGMCAITNAIPLISTVIALWTAVAAFLAAWATQRSAKATREAVEATLIASFYDEYFDQSMSDALRFLAGLGNEENFAKRWIQGMQTNDPQARVADGFRRKVKGYFHKAAALYLAGLIPPSTFRLVAYQAGLNIYYEVVEPMEVELGPNHNRQIIELLRDKLGKYKESEGITPIPAP
jgi:hypothetical protein